MYKIFIYILFGLIFSSFFGYTSSDWRDEFFKQEKYKITKYQTIYEYKNNEYQFSWADSSYETFNENNVIISSDHSVFYLYDESGKLTAEKTCTRNCDNPSQSKYCYDKKGNLIQVLSFDRRDTIPFMVANYKYKNDLLAFKELFLTSSVFDSKPTLEIYTYYPNNTLRSKTKREFSTNVHEWRTYIDSLYYDNEYKLIRKERREMDLDLTGITYYFYNSQKQLIQTKDTATTSLEWYKYPLEVNTV